MAATGPGVLGALVVAGAAAVLVFTVTGVLVRTPAPAAELAPPAPTVPEWALAAAVPPPASETPTAAAVTEAPVGAARLVIRGAGDVNLDPGALPALAAEGWPHAWSGLDGIFLDDDVSIVNLECAPSELGSPEIKEFTFRCPPEALPAMAAAGVEVAHLANNHSRDYGAEALLDGIEQVTDAGVIPVGVGPDHDAAATPAVVEVNGWRVALLGFGGVVPTPEWIATDERAGMADGDDIPSMVAAVEDAAAVADLVVVSIHWGVELDTEPRAEDVDRAHAIIDAGADVILGHHAHRLQPLGWYRDRPIAWGLGNLVWGRYSEPGRTTAVAEVVVESDGSIGACLRPAWIESSAHPVLVEPVGELCTPEGESAPPLGAAD